ncbi:MAG: hypothetical protein CFE44_25430, partial [Burkholderiales bacterium PBB4]
MARHFTLRLALPFALLAAVVFMLLVSFLVDIRKEREAVLDRVRDDAVLTAEHIARTAERGLSADPKGVAADLAVASTEPQLEVMLVVDSGAKVIVAQRLAWQGQAATQVVNDFSMERFQRVVRGNLPDVEVAPDLNRLSVMSPYVLGSNDQNLRNQERGVTYVEYVLTRDYERVYWGAWQRLLPQISIAVAMILVLMWQLRRQ